MMVQINLLRLFSDHIRQNLSIKQEGKKIKHRDQEQDLDPMWLDNHHRQLSFQTHQIMKQIITVSYCLLYI